jgi:uncharacterized MnhB-related membrane protein
MKEFKETILGLMVVFLVVLAFIAIFNKDFLAAAVSSTTIAGIIFYQKRINKNEI